MSYISLHRVYFHDKPPRHHVPRTLAGRRLVIRHRVFVEAADLVAELAGLGGRVG